MSEAWMRRLMFQAYAFVLGVASGKFHPLAAGESRACFVLFALLLAFSLFGFVQARRGRFPALAAALLFGLSCFFLGWGRFSVAVHTSDPNHISKFAGESWKNRVSVEGVIITDPENFGDHATFTLNPLRVLRGDESEYREVSGGRVEVSIRRTAGELYKELSQSQVYGWRIRVNAPLLLPPGATNPYGFSYRDMLADEDIYAVQTVAASWGSPPPVEILDRGDGFFLTEWAIRLKEKVVDVFVRTIPYPESTFLAGVTLGMKSVLQNVVCIFPGHDRLILDECRVAGVSHVLAVSGQHVTILSGMLLAILSLFRLPLRTQAPIIIFVLVIFMIITGMPPSAMRATLMNSLAIFFLAMSRGGFKISILFAIAEAAMIVLMVNPKNIVQPSFTLSFAAVLSLSLISGPMEKLLIRLRGPGLLWAIFSVFLITALSTAPCWETFSSPACFIPLTMVLAGGFLWCQRSAARQRWPDFSFERCSPLLRLFLVAQGAILIGMMFPLSSFYFGRYALAGPYANFFAIPLTGVIVPIGLLAGLVGMIPGFGFFIALVLNAANDVYIKIFFYISHAADVFFPYPFVKNFTVGQLGVYYAGIAAFVWWEEIYFFGKNIYNRFYKYAPDPRMRRSAAGMAAVAAILLVLLAAQAWRRPLNMPPGTLRVTFLSTSFGGSAVIQSPNGKTYVVDGSLNNRQAHSDAGGKIIAPFLLKQGIKTLDAVVLTNAGPEHTEGLASIFGGFDVRGWYDPMPVRDIRHFAAVAASDSEEACRIFFKDLGDPYLEKNMGAPHVRRICESYTELAKIRERRNIPRIRATRGIYVENTQINGMPFRMQFLGPRPEAVGLKDLSGVLKVEYGAFSVLFTGDLGGEELASLLSESNESFDILVVPQHGLTAEGRSPELLRTVRPQVVIFQSGNPKNFYGKSREARPLVDQAKEDYNSNRVFYEEVLTAEYVFDPRLDWAVVVDSDGKKYRVHSLKQKQNSAPEG